MLFSYHNKLKKLLKEEPYICIKESGKFAYRFVFPRIMTDMPIRDHRIEEYKEYIRKGGCKI